MDADKLVIGLAGMPGSGKSVVVDMAREMGYDIVVMGDVIRQETLKRGLELTPQNVGKVMLELRQESGNFVIAQKCIPKIEEQASSKVLVDGLRSLFEADIFKEHFTKFSLVSVHASPQTRFNRLSSRRRSDDPAEWKVFQERDNRELGVGLGNVIAMAEQMIVNEDSLEHVKTMVKESLGRIERKWK
ncbi:MAG: AAA family ATPase [Ignavibacteria bacterium]